MCVNSRFYPCICIRASSSEESGRGGGGEGGGGGIFRVVAQVNQLLRGGG